MRRRKSSLALTHFSPGVEEGILLVHAHSTTEMRTESSLIHTYSTIDREGGNLP
jgi:hypothetical protein